MKKIRKTRFFTTASVTMAIILAACAATACGGGGKSQYSAGGDMMYAAETAAASPQRNDYDAMPAAAPVTDWNGEYGKMEVMEEEVSLTTAQEDSGAFDNESPAPAGPANNANRKLIRTVHLNVETTEFDNLLADLRRSATETGGYIEQSEVSGSSISSSQPGRRYAYLVVRVPSDHLDPFLSQINEQSNVTNRSENIEDVTLQYSDIESRKKTLAVEQERLWALLEKADTLEAVIALEERLSEIRYELESYESRLRLYDNQIDYSTVHINIDEVRVFTPTTPDSVATRIQKGFSRNLEGVTNGLVDFVVGLLSSLPTLILLAVIFGVMVLIGKLLYKIVKKKFLKILAIPKEKTKPAQPAAAQPESQQPPQQKP